MIKSFINHLSFMTCSFTRSALVSNFNKSWSSCIQSKIFTQRPYASLSEGCTKPMTNSLPLFFSSNYYSTLSGSNSELLDKKLKPLPLQKQSIDGMSEFLYG